MPPAGGRLQPKKKVQVVLGRLPLRYRLTIWLTGLLSFAGLGAWFSLVTPLPLVWSSGAGLGALVGVVIVAAYLSALEGGRAARRPADPAR